MKPGVTTFSLFLALFFSPVSTGIFAQQPADAQLATSYLERIAHFGFSGSVYLSRGDQVLIDDAFGRYLCSDDTLVSVGDRFAIASLSKSFTAAAILSLADDGRLDIDDPLSRFFPEAPRATGEITIRDLLTHRSGIGRLPEEQRRRPLQRDEYVAGLLAADPVGEPGAATFYSNEGYSLLAALVEIVSETSFEKYLRSRLFVPAGLAQTRVITEGRPDDEPLAVACRGELLQGDPYRFQLGAPNWKEVGPTGIVSTASDLGRWARALMWGELLSDESRMAMFSAPHSRFGLGWVVQDRGAAGPMIWHDGLLLPEGWNSQIRIYPETETVLVVLSNQYDGDALGWRVARDLDRLLHGGEIRFPPPATALSPETPVVLLELADQSGSRIVLDTTGVRPSIAWEGQSVTNLFLEASDEDAERLNMATEQAGQFFRALVEGRPEEALEGIEHREPESWLPDLNETVAFLETSLGTLETAEAIHSMLSPQYGDVIETWVRLRFSDGTSVVRVSWIEGRWWSVSDQGSFLGASKSLPAQPGRIFLSQTGDRIVGYDLQSDELIEVEVIRDDDGEVTGLRLKNGRDSIETRLGVRRSTSRAH